MLFNKYFSHCPLDGMRWQNDASRRHSISIILSDWNQMSRALFRANHNVNRHGISCNFYYLKKTNRAFIFLRENRIMWLMLTEYSVIILGIIIKIKKRKNSFKTQVLKAFAYRAHLKLFLSVVVTNCRALKSKTLEQIRLSCYLKWIEAKQMRASEACSGRNYTKLKTELKAQNKTECCLIA